MNKYPACGDAVYLYPSSTATDDLLWAASWMYAATTTNSYLTDAVSFYQSFMTNNQDGEACLPLRHLCIWHQLCIAKNMPSGMHSKCFADALLPVSSLRPSSLESLICHD